jgi:medium-chain acyl-[acyl-carrier-protein] hydrolase
MSSNPADRPARYRLSFTVRASEAGPYGAVKLASLLDYFQEAAGEHAARLGVSVSDLIQRNLTWVLSRYHIKIFRYPLWGETVRVMTWPSARQHLFALREFEAADERGNPVASATSSWMLLDLAARKPVRPADRLGDYAQDPARAIDDDFRPLPTLRKPELEQTFRVRQGDLDWNRHANHVVYVEWGIEAAPPELVGRSRPREIEVDFRGEARYGDEIVSRVETLPAGSGSGLIHQIVRRGDGAELARLRTAWTEAWRPAQAPSSPKESP